MVSAQEFAWYAAIICMFVSSAVAQWFLKANFRLFTAMALFAFAWVLVSAAYVVPGASRTPGERQLVNLCSDVAAVLLIYVGGLLTNEVRTQHAGHRLPVSLELTIPLRLAYLIALPRAFAIPGAIGQWLNETIHFKQLTAEQAETIAGELIIAIGFISIVRGVKELCGWTAISKSLVAILIYYEGISLWQTYLSWDLYHPMSTFFLLSFGAVKLAMTGMYCGCKILGASAWKRRKDSARYRPLVRLPVEKRVTPPGRSPKA